MCPPRSPITGFLHPCTALQCHQNHTSVLQRERFARFSASDTGKFCHKPISVLSVLLLQCQLQACLNPSCVCSVQNECQVSLNTVDSLESFVSEINNGRWDQVLPVVSRLKLPHGKLESLYELVSQRAWRKSLLCRGTMHTEHILHLQQVVLEMVELREVDTARAVLRQTPVFNRMKQEEPDRFLKLEHLCGRTYFDTKYVHDFS